MDTYCPLDPESALICEAYTALRRESAYEAWTNDVRVLGALPIGRYSPVYPGIGDIPDGLATFQAPRQFWSGDGKGIADYTNRNFFSAGTMNESPPYTDMQFDVALRDLCVSATPGCGVDVLPSDYVTFFPTYVDDRFRPAGGPVVNNYAASESLFNPEFTHYADDSLRTVNRFTFAKAHEFLIPRAVGYSAGLINYFFRGTMDISLPDEGVYGIVDQSPAGCGVPCGFRTVKLKLKNTTPGTGAYGEEKMGDEKASSILIAVAKYHTNTCYRPDLSGEDGGIFFAGKTCRSVEEFVSVSAARKVNVISADRPQPFTFDFSANPIPINSSDLVLQVVFRGQLGLETDAVAVNTLDISEPTYYSLENVTDYAFDDLGDQKYHPTVYTIKVDNIAIAFGPDATTNRTIATLDSLDGGEHAELAFLMARGPQPDTISWSGQFAREPDVVNFDPALFTQEDEGGAAGLYQRNCDVAIARGLYMDRGTVFARLAHGISTWMPKSGRSDVLPMSRESFDSRGTQPKSERDPRCLHLTGGLNDLSDMTPFVPETAKRWTISF